MTPKKNRLDTRTVKKVFAGGRFSASLYFTFKYIFDKNSPNSVKISFIVPKSIAKLSVKRNLLRRLGYAALEKHLYAFPGGTLGIFVFKKYETDVLAIENEIKKIIDKIH